MSSRSSSGSDGEMAIRSGNKLKRPNDCASLAPRPDGTALGTFGGYSGNLGNLGNLKHQEMARGRFRGCQSKRAINCQAVGPSDYSSVSPVVHELSDQWGVSPSVRRGPGVHAGRLLGLVGCEPVEL
jgi:hypothetical protein